MFTGIITDVGILEKITVLDMGKRFKIITAYNIATIKIGASIAHAGVCLTVVNKSEDFGNWYEVEAWKEALLLTILDAWREGEQINLERSLKIGDELGGHLVSGHVDGIARMIECKDEGGAWCMRFQAPFELAQFIAQKGSVTLNGTSLTVNWVERELFDCLLIAHTLEVTTWKKICQGDLVNIEVDQMARYAARLTQFSEQN